MIKAIAVCFTDKGRQYYFDPGTFDLSKKMPVIVKTEKGMQYGITATDIFEMDESHLTGTLKPVVRLASIEDEKQNDDNIEEAKKALKRARGLVDQYKLNMYLIDASYTFEREQLLFHFLADNRVDFRSLARDLASIYRTRIELRQIGVRDKAKEIGGLGPCGRPLCCASCLDSFETVSISMAKNQNIALNPTKINGVCGRLLCCLKYEDDLYTDYRQGLPKVGDKHVKTAKGEGRVTEVNVLARTYKVDVPDVGLIEVKADERA